MRLESKTTRVVVLRAGRNNPCKLKNGLKDCCTNGNNRNSKLKRKKKVPHTTTLIIFVLCLFVLPIVGVRAWENNQNVGAGEIKHLDANEVKGTSHAPIHINGNADFANQAASEGWPGDGSQGNPYIIDGYEINGNGGRYCIWIENTNVYFVIRNCNVYNATDYPVPFGTGIALDKVMNGKLEYNKCNNSNHGIHLYGASGYTTEYNNITNNNVSGNIWYGIVLDSYSSNNTVANNKATGNPCAIYVYSSCNNYIANNNVSSNGNGIYLYTSSCNNSITNNNASNNTNVGIYLKSSSSNNYIANNNVSSNSYYGFYLSSSCNNNNITNNNASRNSKYGFYLSSSNNNILTYNWICNNANYGVYITSSSTGNYIHHNNFIANNGASKGVNGECQAYDNVGSNLWYDSATNKGNYWSNWDNSGSYPIDGGAGASDGNPLSEPVREFSAMPLFAVIFGGIIGITWFRRRKN